MNVSISSDPQPGSVLVWERSGHHGDETDCIICSVAVWHKELCDGGMDGQAAGYDMSPFSVRGSLPSMMSLICSMCDCVSVCMRILSYSSLATNM